MGITLDVDEMVHIANLLRINHNDSNRALRENPLDIEATNDLKKSRSCLMKITLSALDDRDETPDAVYFPNRPGLN